MSIRLTMLAAAAAAVAKSGLPLTLLCPCITFGMVKAEAVGGRLEARFAVKDVCCPLMVECLLDTGLFGEFDGTSACLGCTPFLKPVEGNCGSGLAAAGVAIELSRFIGEWVIVTG